jgi:hypothetical protein
METPTISKEIFKKFDPLFLRLFAEETLEMGRKYDLLFSYFVTGFLLYRENSPSLPPVTQALQVIRLVLDVNTRHQVYQLRVEICNIRTKRLTIDYRKKQTKYPSANCQK